MREVSLYLRTRLPALSSNAFPQTRGSQALWALGSTVFVELGLGRQSPPGHCCRRQEGGQREATLESS